MMKKIFPILMMAVSMTACAQQVTELPAPDMNRKTLTVMETYKQRHSEREFDGRMLGKQDMADLLWAAQGKNRDNGKLTSPTALNKQEVSVYVFTAENVSLYNPQKHTLTAVADGDHRDIIAGHQDFVKTAPVVLVMVADMAKLGGNDQRALMMASVDAGIVCQSVNIFCAAAGLRTVPRATMDQKAIQKLLGLTDSQVPVMNNPVGY